MDCWPIEIGGRRLAKCPLLKLCNSRIIERRPWLVAVINWHSKPVLICREIKLRLMISWHRHVRHKRCNRLQISHVRKPDARVALWRKVVISIRDVPAVNKQLEVLGYYTASEGCNGVRWVGSAHVGNETFGEGERVKILFFWDAPMLLEIVWCHRHAINSLADHTIFFVKIMLPRTSVM